MTAIIAIRDGKRIMLGADSVAQRSTACSVLEVPGNSKIGRVNGSKHCFISGSGVASELMLLRRIPNLLNGKEDVDLNYVVKHVVPKIFNQLKEDNFLTKVEVGCHMNVDIVLVTKNHMFSINNYGIVREGRDIIANGSGYDTLLAEYKMIKDEKMPLEEKVLKCLKAAVEFGPSIGYPLVTADTVTDEIKVYEK